MGLMQQVRWLAGSGYVPADFEAVYAGGRANGWGYDRDAFHRRRFDRIVAALPERPIGQALEVGCAEGHFTRWLAPRVGRLVACDFCDEALDRARRRCGDLPNVQLVHADARTALPGGPYDLMIFCDVLYYFTVREIDALAVRAAQAAASDGGLLFANEWQPHYRRLTSPDRVIRCLDASGLWRLVDATQQQDPAGPSLTVTLFRRRTEEPR